MKTALMQDQHKKRRFHLFPPSGGQSESRDLLPDLKFFLHLLTIDGGRKPMPTRSEMLGDGAIGGEKTLGLTGRLKALHTSLALAGGLMRVLGAITEIAMLAMLGQRA